MSKLKEYFVTVSLFILVLIGFMGTAYQAIMIALGAAALMQDYGQATPKAEIMRLFFPSSLYFLGFLLLTGISLSIVHKRK